MRDASTRRAGRLSEILGRQVVVENAGGAGGMIGTNRVAKAASCSIDAGSMVRGFFASRAARVATAVSAAGAASSPHVVAVLRCVV